MGFIIARYRLLSREPEGRGLVMPALLLPVAAMIGATIPPTDPAACTDDRLVRTSNATPPRARPLGEMPDGVLMRAVILRAGPCSLRIVRTPSGFDGGTWRYEVDGPAAARATPAGGR
jgi:hypothetical protein